MKRDFWAAIGAIGALLGGVAALAAVFVVRPEFSQPSDAAHLSPTRPSTAFYIDGCNERLRAINLRAAVRQGSGDFAVKLSPSPKWCNCTARVLEANFDDQTVRQVGEWFQATALGGAEKSAEDAHFATFSSAERTRIESAYDFSSRQCSRKT